LIDFHCHLLPNIDDGPDHIDDSVAMAAALCDAGFAKVYCTPHLIKGSFEADNETVKAAVLDLQARLDAENIDIEVLPGREYYLDEYLLDYLRDPMTMGDTQYVMIEIPGHALAEFAKDTLFRIKCSRLIPMIAHPERCGLLAISQKQEASSWLRFSKPKNKIPGAKPYEPTLLDYLRDLGCAFQCNLGSLAGWYGPEVLKAAKYLQQRKIYTNFGTDAHSPRGINRLPRNIIDALLSTA
jgi:protein-tyrosine phosphatase